MVTFRTKDGKTVSFKAKGEKKARTRRPKTRIRRVSRSRARPKTQKRQTMAKRHRKSSRGSSSGNLTNVLLGGAVAGFIGGMIPYGDYGKLGAALVAHKQGGILGNTAKALGVIGAANLVQHAGIGQTAMPSLTVSKF